MHDQLVDQRRGTRENDDRDEGEAPEPDHRGALRQRQRGGEGIAQGIPGKTGQHMAAQPFGRGQRHTEREDAERTPRPQHPRHRHSERSKERKHRRQADDRDREQPAEGRRIDQEGVADPVEAGEEIAEAEPPARRRRDGDAAPAAQSGAVDEPDQDRKGQEQNRPRVERRHRRRRQGAGGEGDQPTSPPPRQHDRVDDVLRLHGVGGEFGLGRPASSRAAGARATDGRSAFGRSRAAPGRRSLRR